jgi:hypothetical protein
MAPPAMMASNLDDIGIGILNLDHRPLPGDGHR